MAHVKVLSLLVCRKSYDVGANRGVQDPHDPDNAPLKCIVLHFSPGSLACHHELGPAICDLKQH